MATGEPGKSPKKRVKIFTVHGTFAHDANWDNWDDKDGEKDTPDDRSFVNRLSEYLGAKGVAFEKADHAEYNWSGGNSHDERRTAAIGLKQFIQHDLDAAKAKHGKDHKDYYDGGIYVIGHSHGGTISRLAMNLWDQGDEYFDPKATDADVLKHNDKCQICKQRRNGEVIPNTIPRPDGVVTFGSPFVHFKKKKSGLLASRLIAWALIVPGIAAVIGFYIFLFLNGGKPPAVSPFGIIKALQGSPLYQTAVQVLWPAALFWLFALYIPKRFVATVERIFGRKSRLRFAAAITSRALHLIGLASLGAYYIAYVFPGSANLQSWFDTLSASWPFSGFWLWFPLVVFWLLAFSLPRRVLKWVKSEVAGLRDELPKKYDPAEDADNPTPYLSYHTPGDEAGLGLHAFGFITWFVQTLWLAAGVVMLTGIATLALMFIGSYFTGGDGIAGLPGFVTVIDALTLYPMLIWNWVFGWFTDTSMFRLGGLENATAVAKQVPSSFTVVALLMLVALIPLILVATGIANLVSVWLRKSGLAFGSERFAWTVANKISANSRPSIHTKMQSVMISPEAWSKGEVAHCYYYQSDEVIRDVASQIADWRNLVLDKPNTFGPMLATAARWLVVLFFVLSMFMLAVQGAKDQVDSKAAAAAKAEAAKVETPATAAPAPPPK